MVLGGTSPSLTVLSTNVVVLPSRIMHHVNYSRVEWRVEGVTDERVTD